MFKIIEQIIHIKFNQQHIGTQTERHIHLRTKIVRKRQHLPSLTAPHVIKHCRQWRKGHKNTTHCPQRVRALYLRMLRFRNEWCINLPNHAIIWGSEHLIRNTNCSEELRLKKEESLIYIFWKSNSRSIRLSWQWRTKCSSSSTTLQDIHSRWSIFNLGRV